MHWIDRFSERNFVLFGTRDDPPDASTLETRAAAVRLPMIPAASGYARKLIRQVRSKRAQVASSSA